MLDFHPDKNEIVFSDTNGAVFEFRPIIIRLVRGIIFVIIMLNYGILNFKSLPDGFSYK